MVTFPSAQEGNPYTYRWNCLIERCVNVESGLGCVLSCPSKPRKPLSPPTGGVGSTPPHLWNVQGGGAWQGRGWTRATKEKCDPGVNLTVETARGTPVLQDWSPRSSTVAFYLPAAEAHLPVEPSSLRLFCAFFCLCKPLLWPKVHFKLSSLVSPADRIQICFRGRRDSAAQVFGLLPRPFSAQNREFTETNASVWDWR